jgi:hypothetical protein
MCSAMQGSVGRDIAEGFEIASPVGQMSYQAGMNHSLLP